MNMNLLRLTREMNHNEDHLLTASWIRLILTPKKEVIVIAIGPVNANSSE